MVEPTYYSVRDIEWAKSFLQRHPGPSDPREFDMLRDDWILAKNILKWVKENSK